MNVVRLPNLFLFGFFPFLLFHFYKTTILQLGVYFFFVHQFFALCRASIFLKTD